MFLVEPKHSEEQKFNFEKVLIGFRKLITNFFKTDEKVKLELVSWSFKAYHTDKVVHHSCIIPKKGIMLREKML